MPKMTPYQDFCERFKLLIGKNTNLITITLSNIFTMRLIGNKTHGDLAEIAISEFINQYMYDFKSKHVGKDLYRAKEHEEDIEILNELTKEKFPVSLKAYGDGPLQLSTDKESSMFPRLEQEAPPIETPELIKAVFDDTAFREISTLNILPLIYDEEKKKCNIMVFDYAKAKEDTVKIKKETNTGNRKHPVYIFENREGNYICEVRYGSKTANALQRGMWTHTKKGFAYFKSLTNGWIDYSHNLILVALFSHALVSSKIGHEKALQIIKEDIDTLKPKPKDSK